MDPEVLSEDERNAIREIVDLFNEAGEREGLVSMEDLRPLQQLLRDMPRELQEAFFQKIGGPLIDIESELYEQTGNPIHAWHAWYLARASGLRVPAWVLKYIDNCATALYREPRPRSGKAIADALGLGTRGGASVTTKAETAERDRDVVDEVNSLRENRRRPGIEVALDDLIEIVAKKYNLSFDRVRRIYYTQPKKSALVKPSRATRRIGPS